MSDYIKTIRNGRHRTKTRDEFGFRHWSTDLVCHVLFIICKKQTIIKKKTYKGRNKQTKATKRNNRLTNASPFVRVKFKAILTHTAAPTRCGDTTVITSPIVHFTNITTVNIWKYKQEEIQIWTVGLLAHRDILQVQFNATSCKSLIKANRNFSNHK